MTNHPELFASLAAPFEEYEIKARSQSGRVLHYVTARTVMNRFDNVVGPENWWDEYEAGENSVLCRLTIRLPDGTTLTKADAGGYAGMSDSGDDDKSGYSDAFKRAAVKFGVARYLYRDGVPSFVSSLAGEVAQVTPPTPVQAPAESAPASTPVPARSGTSPSTTAPKTGRALFAWTKEQEQRHEVGLLKYLNQWAKLQDFPGRMVDWNADQVSIGYEEAIRKMSSLMSRSDAYEEALSN